MTDKQRLVLLQVRDGLFYVYGASNVRAAQKLHAKGYLDLTDNGSLDGNGGNRDGERWSAEITESGRAALVTP